MIVDSNTYQMLKSDTQITEGASDMDRKKRNEMQQAWDKENTVHVSVKLQKATDADILAYLEGKQKQTEIKKALRLMIQMQNQNQ